MIVTGRISTTWAWETYVHMELTFVSQDIATNSSKVRMVVKIEKRNNYNDNFRSEIATITGSVGGVNISQQGLTYDLRNAYNKTVTMIDKTLTIPHNADGSKMLDANFSFKLNPVGAVDPTEDYAYGYGSAALQTIARGSSFTFGSNSYFFDTTITGTIQRSNSSFKHKISYTTPNGDTVVVDENATTEFEFSVPITYASQMPTTTYYNSTITLETKNGSTVIGSTTTEISLVLPRTYKSTVKSLSPAGFNTLIGNNTATAYNYLGNIDVIKTSITINNYYGATTENVEYRLLNSSGVEQAKATVGGIASASILAPQVSSNELFTLQARVTDSRGLISDWFSAPIKVRSHAYQSPTINTLSVRRSPTSETALTGTLSGWRVQSVYNAGGTSGQANTANMTVKYRKRGTTAWTNLSTSTALSSTSYTLSFTGHTFSPGENYEFQATVTDKFGKSSSTAITLVGAVFVHMDFGPNGVGIGKDHSDSPRDLEIGSGGFQSDGPGIISSTDSKVLQLKGSDHAYMELHYGGSRKSYVGFPTPGNANLVIANEALGKNLMLGNSLVYGGLELQSRKLTEVDGKAVRYTGDLNELVTTGFYDVEKAYTTNLPVVSGAHSWWYVIVVRHNDYHVVQIAIDFSNTATCIRTATGSTTRVWKPWKDISATQSFPSSTNNADSSYVIIGDIQICWGVIVFNQFHSKWTLNGSATFARSFSNYPRITLSTYTYDDNNYYAGSPQVKTVTGLSFKGAFSNSDFTSGTTRTASYIAIGRA